MKKILILFVLAFGLMSFTSIENVNVSNTDDITNSSEVLNDYEISVEYSYSDEIDCWTCSVTIVNPDFSTTTISASSCISASMACFYVGRKLTKMME